MEFDVRAVAAIGVEFSVESRRLGVSWKGGLEEICAEMRGAGLVVGEVWNDGEAQVRAKQVVVTLGGMLAQQMGAGLQGMLPRLKEALGSEGGLDDQEFGKVFAGYDRAALAAVSRVGAAAGAASFVRRLAGLDAGALGEVDAWGMAAVSWACAFGRLEVYRVVVGLEGMRDPVNRFGWTWAQLAEANTHRELAGEVLAAGGKRGETLAARLRGYGIAVGGG